MNTITSKLSWRFCFKDTMLLALPILGAHIVEALIPFINVTLAATLGQTALAAAGLVGATFLALMGFCWGVTASVGIITANKIGENNESKDIGLGLWGGFLTAILLSLPVMLIFNWIDKIWLYFGQDSAVVLESSQYIRGLMLAVPADLAKFAIFQFAIACGKPRIPLIANIISVPFLTMVSYFMIQHYGMYGIGLGTAIIYWIIFLGMLSYLLISPSFKTYLLRRCTSKELVKVCMEQFQLGIPIGLMFSIELIFFMVLTLFMGSLGGNILAANQIAMQWLWLTIMLAYGFTEAVTILVAKANGAKNPKQIIQYTYVGALFSVLSMFVIALIYWKMPEWIIGIDINIDSENTELIQLAIKLLVFCGIYQIVDALRIVISGALRGMEDSKYPMWVTTFSFWLIGLPVGYVFAFLLHFQAAGLWVGLITAAIISTALQYYRLQKKISMV